MVPAWVVIPAAGEAGVFEVAFVAKCAHPSGVELQADFSACSSQRMGPMSTLSLAVGTALLSAACCPPLSVTQQDC